jgi:hypothetical protein
MKCLVSIRFTSIRLYINLKSNIRHQTSNLLRSFPGTFSFFTYKLYDGSNASAFPSFEQKAPKAVADLKHFNTKWNFYNNSSPCNRAFLT